MVSCIHISWNMHAGFTRQLTARRLLPSTFKPRRPFMSSAVTDGQHLARQPRINSHREQKTVEESPLIDLILDGSRTTALAHKVWQRVVQSGDTVIDATCGNGNDTLMLAKLALTEDQGTDNGGNVIGLDLQRSALDNTASLLDRKLTSRQREKVSLLQLCHSQLDTLVAEDSVRLVAFNLGYQPGGDKSFVTRANTTVKAMGAAVNVLKSPGLISVLSYIGHPGGREEHDAVKEFMSDLPSDEWVCSHMEWINIPLCPHLFFLLRK